MEKYFQRVYVIMIRVVEVYTKNYPITEPKDLKEIRVQESVTAIDMVKNLWLTNSNFVGRIVHSITARRSRWSRKQFP